MTGQVKSQVCMMAGRGGGGWKRGAHGSAVALCFMMNLLQLEKG